MPRQTTRSPIAIRVAGPSFAHQADGPSRQSRPRVAPRRNERHARATSGRRMAAREVGGPYAGPPANAWRRSTGTRLAYAALTSEAGTARAAEAGRSPFAPAP